MRYTKKHIIIRRAVKGRGFHAPAYSVIAHRIIRMVGGLYMKYIEKNGKIRVENLNTFLEAFSSFQRGDSRLILAFRHPSRKDPPVLAWTFNHIIPELAKKSGSPLKKIPHARFLYGVDVLNWAGLPAVLTFPRLGYIPVENLGTNRDGMDILKKELIDGNFPIALAPEGQVTYHTRHCSPIASGTATLAQWGLESGKDVKILPIALDYDFQEPIQLVIKLLSTIEQKIAQKIPGLFDFQKSFTLFKDFDRLPSLLRSLLFHATDSVLTMLETFYRMKPSADKIISPEILKERIKSICLQALEAAEALSGIRGNGDILSRLFRIRYEGMNRFYTNNFEPKKLNSQDRSIADFRTVEAEIYLRHTQIIDALEYVDPDYIGEIFFSESITPGDKNLYRMAEYALNILDVINRLNGGNIESRYYPSKQNVMIKAGNIINSREILEEGKSRKTARQNLSKKIWEELQNISTDL